MRKAATIISLVFLAALAGGCADDNSEAPQADQPHMLGAQWQTQLPGEHAAGAIDNSPPCFSCHQMTTAQSGAPACRECHTAGPPNFVLGTCDSCHDFPPDGDVYPNQAGAHSAHNALANVTGDCDTCHSGAGTNTLNHYDTSAPADVAFLAAYDAKTGPASFTPDFGNPETGTCSNVSCHGGLQTPPWLTGQINVDQDCKQCHVLGTAFQTPQYNSPYTGKHQFHVQNLRLLCTNCHDPVKLESDHFVGLNTPQFEGDPAATIQDFINFNAQFSTCTNNFNGVCHDGETRTW